MKNYWKPDTSDTLYLPVILFLFQKPFLEAYVAGWGADNSQCDSNDFGPSPHTMCKFPFVYKGKPNRLSMSTVKIAILACKNITKYFPKMNGFFSQEQLIQDVQECQLHLMMTLFANSSSTRWHQKE